MLGDAVLCVFALIYERVFLHVCGDDVCLYSCALVFVCTCVFVGNYCVCAIVVCVRMRMCSSLFLCAWLFECFFGLCGHG
jgi:hypothetical protein